MQQDEEAIRSSFKRLTVLGKSHAVIDAREPTRAGQDRWKLSIVVKILSQSTIRVAGLKEWMKNI